MSANRHVAGHKHCAQSEDSPDVPSPADLLPNQALGFKRKRRAADQSMKFQDTPGSYNPGSAVTVPA